MNHLNLFCPPAKFLIFLLILCQAFFCEDWVRLLTEAGGRISGWIVAQILFCQRGLQPSTLLSFRRRLKKHNCGNNILSLPRVISNMSNGGVRFLLHILAHRCLAESSGVLQIKRLHINVILKKDHKALPGTFLNITLLK